MLETQSVPVATLQGRQMSLNHIQVSTSTITGGVRHNLPKEVPQAFANAVIDVSQG